MYYFARAAVEVPAWLKQQKCIVWLFWRLEIQSQCDRKAMLSLKALGEDRSLTFLLASGNPLVCVSITSIFTWHSP